MAKKDKTPMPDNGSDTIITVLSILAALALSVTVAISTGIFLSYRSAVATREEIPRQSTSVQQRPTQPVQNGLGDASSPVENVVSPGDLSTEDSSDSTIPDQTQDPGPDQQAAHTEATQPKETQTPTATTSPGNDETTTTQKTSPDTGTTSKPSAGNQSGGVVTISPNPIQTEPSTSGNSGEGAQQNPLQSDNRIVYKTKTGRRYHYDNSCNGGTYIESTMEEVTRLGLTPCNKCVLN